MGLAALPLAAAAAKRRGREADPDSAPGHTARRSSGEYRVVGRSVTIARPRAELYAFWREFPNLSQFMANLEKVEPAGSEPGHHTWHIRTIAGQVRAVDTRIAREVDGELIAWRSTGDSEVDTEGRVTFADAPGERGTRVSLIIAYKPAAGAVGDALANLARQSPELQARHDLKRFKMLMETGEIATAARTRAEHQRETEEAR
ncbi:SRPBCC family protein [Porphyrobacter sp. AAP82]|uniref:SRPBCC family protein n=1 Tax=Porphyrobacter sp. AAP82 TaxID=1248917 RepID=UPI001F267602|nr:SRPBCC family protein [Porphyrobacter sp. AAP82]